MAEPEDLYRPIKSADAVKSVCLVFLTVAARGKSGDAFADSAMVLPEVPVPVFEEKPTAGI